MPRAEDAAWLWAWHRHTVHCRNVLIAFAHGRQVVKSRAEIHSHVSTSLDSHKSSEVNTAGDRPRTSSTDGDESGDDPPEQKPSRLKRRQVARTSLQRGFVWARVSLCPWAGGHRCLSCHSPAILGRKEARHTVQTCGQTPPRRSFCRTRSSAEWTWCPFYEMIGKTGPIACGVPDT